VRKVCRCQRGNQKPKVTRTKTQQMVYNTLHRKLKIKQYEAHYKLMVHCSTFYTIRNITLVFKGQHSIGMQCRTCTCPFRRVSDPFFGIIKLIEKNTMHMLNSVYVTRQVSLVDQEILALSQ
jgi:hypothetical protein